MSILLALAIAFADYHTVLTDFCQDVALDSSETVAVTIFPRCATIFGGSND